MQVDVLEYYDTSVRSASAQFLIPAVLRVRMYVSKRELKSGRLSLSRKNILLRDRGQCQCATSPHLPSWPHPAWTRFGIEGRLLATSLSNAFQPPQWNRCCSQAIHGAQSFDMASAMAGS